MRSNSGYVSAWATALSMLVALLAYSVAIQPPAGTSVGGAPVVQAMSLAGDTAGQPGKKKDDGPCKYKEDCGNIVLQEG